MLVPAATEPSSEAALAALAGDGASQAPEAPADAAAAGGPEKPKRRRRVKKKNPLEDSFPSYLQVRERLLLTYACSSFISGFGPCVLPAVGKRPTET